MPAALHPCVGNMNEERAGLRDPWHPVSRIIEQRHHSEQAEGYCNKRTSNIQAMYGESLAWCSNKEKRKKLVLLIFPMGDLLVSAWGSQAPLQEEDSNS